MPRPKNLKEVQSFLGVVNFYHDFIKDLASIVEPLRNLRSKDVPFDWTPLCEKSFLAVKQMLRDNLRIYIFDPSAPTFVTMDASDVGLGGTLSQLQGSTVPAAITL